MAKVVAIAVNSLKEALQERVLHALIVFALLCGLMGIVLGSLSIAQQVRILADGGLFGILTCGGIIAIFLGSSLARRESDSGTISLIFTKPVKRWQFFAGKFLGLAACLFIATALMGFILILLLCLFLPDQIAAGVLVWAVVLSLLLIVAEELLLLAAALFFSTFTTALMSFVFTLSFWLIAHLSTALLTLGEMSTSISLSYLLKALYFGLPDLSAVSKAQDEFMRSYEIARHAGLEGIELPFNGGASRALPMVLTYIFGYILLLLSMGTFISERREYN